MDRRQWRGLLALNGVLLGVLVLASTLPPADAQQNQRTRQRGEYTMIGGEVQGIPESVIWVIDASNQDMIVLRYEQGPRQLSPLGYRNIAADVNHARAGRGGR